MYYIEKDNIVLGIDEDREILATTLKISPNFTEDDIKKVPDGYVAINGKPLMTVDEYKQEKLKQERERIALLNMTGADVERAIYQAKGMDFDDILAFVQANPPEGLDIKALKIELKANNFYRGNPYVEVIGTLLGFTSNQLNNFFKTGDYKELLPKEEIIKE